MDRSKICSHRTNKHSSHIRLLKRSFELRKSVPTHTSLLNTPNRLINTTIRFSKMQIFVKGLFY
jgi:hypothetical protein